MADDKTKSENRELAKTIGFGNEGFAIQNMAQATLVADTLLSSGLVPAHFNSTAKIIVVAQAAKELGKPLWWGLNNMFVVSGKTGIAAAAAAGLIHEKKICDRWHISETGTFPDDNFAVVVTSRRKGTELEVSTKFSVQDAKTAKLWTKDIWQKYPKQMLTWRAVAFHTRQYYNDVLNGAYTTEELEDITLPPPACDTPPRDERRKPVNSVTVGENGINETDKTIPAGTPIVTDNLFARTPVQEQQAQEITPASNTEGSTVAAVAGITIDDVLADFLKAGGASFPSWAAYVLAEDEENVDKPEKFTAAMLAQLDRTLKTDGVEKGRF